MSISKDEIAQHFKKCVLDKYLEDIENQFMKSIENFNVQCPECDLICPKKSLLNLHIRITHEYEANKFGKDITQEKLSWQYMTSCTFPVGKKDEDMKLSDFHLRDLKGSIHFFLLLDE